MKDELYIDNSPVDIDDNTNITLNYKSNLFTEVSKIVSNNTYSIKLPMTVRNCKVIEHAHLPTSISRFPRINHKGRYLRNGVEIVSDASVTLMEVSDTIDVAMAWGNVSAFAEIVNGDRTLQDLSYGMMENEDYIVWSKELGNSPRLPWLSYGFKNDEPNAWFHPAVSAKWILDKISKDSRVKFVIPESRQGFVERLVIPLLKRNDAPKRIEQNKVILTFQNMVVKSKTEVTIIYYRYVMAFAPISLTNLYLTWGTSDSLITSITPNAINITLHIKWYVKLKFIAPRSVTPYYTIGLYSDSKGAMIAEFNYTSLLNEDDGNVLQQTWIAIYEIDGDYDISSNDISVLEFSTMWNVGLISVEVIDIGRIEITPSIKMVTMGTNNNSFNSHYYYIPNLPDIKQIDFIKAISALCGMFAIPDAGGIRFITMDEIVANKSKALNWTKRVVASYSQNRPKILSFSLDNFAQKNIYKWKDDDEGKNDGIIYVDDKTLDEEEEVITLPFAASEIKSSRTGLYTEIPLYSYNENGELEYNDNLIPRLLVMENQTIATFKGMDWVSIIATQYKTYQEEVREPKVITELIEIPDYELKKLDMSVPIYLGQYGKFYAIISIKAEKTGICECKLFQL